MINKSFLISCLNDIVVFLFIFSMFNDYLLIEYFGENILKVIFVLFIMMNAKTMLNNLKRMNFSQDKTFFIFYIMLIIVFLIQTIIGMHYDYIKPTLSLVSILMIVLYFSRYPLKKLFYFIWIAVMLSIIVCFFNDPIDITTFRKTGGTPDPNTFATYVLAFILISVYLFNINKSRLFLMISTVFFLYGIFFAGSKSSFLVLGIIMIFIWLKSLLYNFKFFFSYKFIVLLVVLLIAATQIDFTKIEVVSNVLGRAQSNKTANARFTSWVAGQHMIEKNVLIGVGLGEFNENTHKYADTYDPSTAPHNMYVQLLAEMGIIVFLFFLVFLSVLLMPNFRLIQNSNFIWVYFSLSTILFMGLTLGLAYWKVLWLFIAIIMNINYIIKKEKRSYLENSTCFT